jgi:pyridoxamine 5'-phosphate oxidase
MILLDCYQAKREYGNRHLTINDVASAPILQFVQWYQEAVAAGTAEPNVMVLSSVDAHMRPDSRVVLLKEVDEAGFIFYSHYESAKGEQFKHNPYAALNFYWSELSRQVRVRGQIELLPAAQSAAYFASRNRESQLAVYACHQSSVIKENEFNQRLDTVNKQFTSTNIPCPPYWGGYRVAPLEVEFWQGRDNRHHDRIRYRLVDNVWVLERLAP